MARIRRIRDTKNQRNIFLNLFRLSSLSCKSTAFCPLRKFGSNLKSSSNYPKFQTGKPGFAIDLQSLAAGVGRGGSLCFRWMMSPNVVVS